jgi:hypothetical protein
MDVLTKYPKRNSDLAFRLIENETIIVSPQEGLARVLNESGSRIWELLDANTTIRDIIDRIILEFEISPEKAQQDVLDFLQELQSKKMVEINDQPETT